MLGVVRVMVPIQTGAVIKSRPGMAILGRGAYCTRLPLKSNIIDEAIDSLVAIAHGFGELLKPLMLGPAFARGFGECVRFVPSSSVKRSRACSNRAHASA